MSANQKIVSHVDLQHESWHLCLLFCCYRALKPVPSIKYDPMRKAEFNNCYYWLEVAAVQNRLNANILQHDSSKLG